MTHIHSLLSWYLSILSNNGEEMPIATFVPVSKMPPLQVSIQLVAVLTVSSKEVSKEMRSRKQWVLSYGQSIRDTTSPLKVCWGNRGVSRKRRRNTDSDFKARGWGLGWISLNILYKAIWDEYLFSINTWSRSYFFCLTEGCSFPTYYF